MHADPNSQQSDECKHIKSSRRVSEAGKGDLINDREAQSTDQTTV